MACYHPIAAQKEGARVVLWPPRGTANLALPCGTCLGCRTARAQQWASRCEHQASQHRWNCFITLTYADEHLPVFKPGIRMVHTPAEYNERGYLDAAALQRFFKRLRKRTGADRQDIRSNRRDSIRYIACGEYGDQTERPHYHAILFNCSFADAYPVGKERYGSHALSELWPLGNCEFEHYTTGAANYVAQYTLKKIGAGDADKDGVWRPAPFLRTSNNVGKEWLRKYATDLTKGYYTSGGTKQGVPRTYVEWLKKERPELHEQLELAKAEQVMANLKAYAERNTKERRQAAELIHKRRKERRERNAV